MPWVGLRELRERARKIGPTQLSFLGPQRAFFLTEEGRALSSWCRGHPAYLFDIEILTVTGSPPFERETSPSELNRAVSVTSTS